SDTQSSDYELLLPSWMTLMSSAGVDAQMLERARAAYARDVAVLPAPQVADIIQAGGFTAPTQFFQAGLMHGWVCQRAVLALDAAGPRSGCRCRGRAGNAGHSCSVAARHLDGWSGVRRSGSSGPAHLARRHSLRLHPPSVRTPMTRSAGRNAGRRTGRSRPLSSRRPAGISP